MDMLASKDGATRQKARKSLVAMGKPAVFSLTHGIAEFQVGSRSLGGSQDSRCDRRYQSNTTVGESTSKTSDPDVAMVGCRSIKKVQEGSLAAFITVP